MGSHFPDYSGSAWLGLVLVVLGVIGLRSVERRVAHQG